MSKIRVALGLSGGVDSAVSAYLLKKSGYDVHCVHLNCFDSDTPGCRGDQDRKDALAVAMHLGLPFQVLDFRKEYQAAVIDYFKKEYLLGRTPNPDVVCNRDIKFGLFLDWSIKAGFDYLATGHYAKIVRKTLISENSENSESRNVRPSENQNIRLSDFPVIRHSGIQSIPSIPSVLNVPIDKHKDQTYFLWAVPRQKFSRVLFPLGNLLKSEVRQIAKDAGLGVADKKDSTGICFVGEVRVEDFLKSLGVKEKKGEVVIKIRNPKSEIRNNAQNSNVQNIKQKDVLNLGNSDLEFVSNFDIRDSNLIDNYAVIGRHKGVWFYTIGQRHGFSTDLQSPKNKDKGRGTKDSLRPLPDRPPLYVIEKDIKKNRLVVGFGAETYRDSFEVSECNWLVSLKEINSKLETRNSKQIQNSNDQNSKQNGFENSNLEHSKIVSDFGFRISDLPRVYVRIRHGGDLMPCQLLSVSNRKLEVALATPARGIAPGQSAVFYSKNEIVLGGGVIQ